MMSAVSVNETNDDLFYNIPDFLLSEILKRLPVKELLRCRCVQKSWFNLITAPDFIKLHLKYHHRDAYLLFRSNYRFYHLRYNDEQCKEFVRLKPPASVGFSEYQSCWAQVSNGLICLSERLYVLGYERTVFLWNPLIQKQKPLPPLDLSQFTGGAKPLIHWSALAFGYVPSIHDYLFVRILYCLNTSLRDSLIICVFSLNTNSWKTNLVQFNHLQIDFFDHNESLFLNGIAYWRVKEFYVDPYVMYFDSFNGTIGFIPFPHVTDHHCLRQFDQSLALFLEDSESNVFHMWLLKRGKDDSSWSWENMINVTLPMSLSPRVLGVRNNTQLLLMSKSDQLQHVLYSYDPVNNKLKGFVQSFEHWYTPEELKRYHEKEPLLIKQFLGSLALLDTD
ncbi:hypothetical protein POM88_026306 [Heracleum sosnowskyi]|uniref:F-box domain-containing protein n=1 Tax=Heracleum sosnowskyi TaxID=360622 RepID=A0AAD8MNR7_9APIA|nr:hypothetical protein POM88_026306 [Heracleum sosnowskyi]